jgi:voltage-gated potassium channel
MWRQEPDGRVSHRAEIVLLVLALLVIPVVLIQESHASHGWREAAAIANWVIWVGFVVEFAFVLVVAQRKGAALRAHWLELLIVVVTPPFIPRVLASLRAARLLRLLQVARLGLLGDQALVLERTLTSRRGFRYIGVFTAVLVIVAGAAISVVDTKDFPNVGTGVWWAIVTVTTVGYGDFVPHSVGGRVVATLVMIVGIGFISVLTATIASTFVANDREDLDSAAQDVLAALTRIEERLERLEAGGAQGS